MGLLWWQCFQVQEKRLKLQNPVHLFKKRKKIISQKLKVVFISFPALLRGHYSLWSQGVILCRKGVIRRSKQKAELICGSPHRLPLEFFFSFFSHINALEKKVSDFPVRLCVEASCVVQTCRGPFIFGSHQEKRQGQITGCSFRQECTAPWRRRTASYFHCEHGMMQIWDGETFLFPSSEQERFQSLLVSTLFSSQAETLGG